MLGGAVLGGIDNGLFVQGAVEVSEGLLHAVFVFDHGDADVTFAFVAECAAGAHGDFGFFDHVEAEVDG